MAFSVVRRLLLMLLVLAAATFASFVFFWTHDLPLKGTSSLDGYRHWVHGLFTGASYRGLFSHEALWPKLGPAVGHTAALLLLTFVFVVPLSIGFAALAASRRDGVLDVVLRAFAYLAWGVPAFLLALVVALLTTKVGTQAGIGPFPIAGWPGQCPPGLGLNGGVLGRCPPAGTGAAFVWNVARYMTIPAATLAVGFVGLHARYLRANLLQTLEAPFITTARAKGLSEWRVLFRHALRISVATFVGGLLADVGAIFGAAVAVDWVFRLGGLGSAFIREFPLDSFQPLDVYSIQLCLLIIGTFVLASTLLADGVLAWLDPRLRRSE